MEDYRSEKSIRPVMGKALLVLVLAAAIVFSPVFSDSNAYASSYPVPTVKATVKASGTAVRKSHSVDSTLIKRLSAGTTFRVTYEYFTSSTSTKASKCWYKLKSGGYVRADLVTVKYTPTKAKTTTALNMRKGPSTSYAKKGTLSSGAALYLLKMVKSKAGGTWYYASRSSSGSSAFYVDADYVTKSSSSSSSSSTSSSSSSSASTTSSTSSYITASGFPSSYLTKLKALHKKHPTWKFTPVKTGLSWSQAYAKMISSTSTNTIYTSYAPSYRSTKQGCFNYLTNSYVAKDGASFVSASDQAVAYYMDPRNWLTETGVFMFESNAYHSYQNISIVRAILKQNSVLYKNAKYYIEAGQKYGISPVYLAAKSISELGSSTKMVNGKYPGYKGYYNAYGIGCSDSSSGGAAKGMKYAKSKNWNTLRKAIVNGAAYISSSFISNKQDTSYLEHFNVRNGLSNVGTHVYMTAVYAPASQAANVYSKYKSYGVLNKSITFYIPVYNNMPSSTSKPSSSWYVDNNYYLKTLTTKAGGKTTKLIKSSSQNYKTSFSVTVPSGSTTVKLSAAKASTTGGSVSGTGTISIGVGTRSFYITCRSSSGLTRKYKVKVVRKS